jgi:site-specific recombinase XerD
MYESFVCRRLRVAYRQSRFKPRMDRCATELLKRGYARSTVREKLTTWVEFACGREDGELPSSVRNAEVIAFLDQRCARRREGHVVIRAALRQFLHDDAHDVRRLPPVRQPSTALFDEHVPAYFEFIRQHGGRRVVTIMRSVLMQFFHWLAQRKVRSVDAIRATHVRAFLASLRHLRRSSVSQFASILRCFFRYLHVVGKVDADLARRVEAPITYRMSHPPPVLSEKAVAKLLRAVNRSTPLGKRDYAILLLAARYGLRPSDVKALRLDQIHWRERTISIVQAKTQRPLKLPLLADVDDAIVDYLRNGRPPCSAREIFVRHRPPIVPLLILNDVLERAFRAAGMTAPARGRGFGIFRHSAATRMLSHGASIDVISDVLGHASVETTRIYAQVDLVGLRSVTMSASAVAR